MNFVVDRNGFAIRATWNARVAGPVYVILELKVWTLFCLLLAGVRACACVLFFWRRTV